MKTQLAIVTISVFLFACGETKKQPTEDMRQPTAINQSPLSGNRVAVAQIQPKSGSSLEGTVTFTEKDGVVSMKADIMNAKPGNHAIHIHETGDCSAEDGKSAGGHWNPTSEDHGKWGEAPFHRGDIGNITVGEDGKGTFERETDLWCVGCMDKNKDILSKSIIVHEGPDDFSSQPSGAAGPRIGCGTIILQ